MGIAAVAMAASVFASDISAATKIGGKLFIYDADENVSVLNQGNDSHDYANPNFVMSLSGDKAGAELKITTNGNVLNPEQSTQSIWFKPFDALKVTVGHFDIALNKETICYTESKTGGLGGDWGYLLSVDASGFTLDAGFNSKDYSNWLYKGADDDDPTIAQFFVKAGYNADFGSIGAYVQFNKTDDIVIQKDGAIKAVLFGAGYKNTFDPVTMFVNVVGAMGDDFEWIRPELFVSGSADAFGYNLFVAPTILVGDVADLCKLADEKTTLCEVVAKLTYALDGTTPYVQFKDVDVLADAFVSEIKIGTSGNCGAMGYNIWAQIDTGIGSKAKFSIPVEFTIGF